MLNHVINVAPEEYWRWLQALRSGDFEQGRTLLIRRDPDTGKDRYCALGLLALQVTAQLSIRERLDSDGPEFCDDATGQRYLKRLPESLMPGETQTWIALLNDNRRCSFVEIADWVEAFVEVRHVEERNAR